MPMQSLQDAIKESIDKWESIEYDEIEERDGDSYITKRVDLFLCTVWTTCPICWYYGLSCEKCFANRKGLCHSEIEDKNYNFLTDKIFKAFEQENKLKFDFCKWKLVRGLEQKLEDVKAR